MGKRFCSNGHDTWVVGRNKEGRCRECRRIGKKLWKRRNSEHVRHYNARYHKANAAKLARKKRRRKYGDAGLSMWDAHNGVCCICGVTAQDARWSGWVIDHDHDTKLLRGVICDTCNRGIGFLGDNLAGLLAATRYLEDHLKRARKVSIGGFTVNSS